MVIICACIGGDRIARVDFLYHVVVHLGIFIMRVELPSVRVVVLGNLHITLPFIVPSTPSSHAARIFQHSPFHFIFFYLSSLLNGSD